MLSRAQKWSYRKTLLVTILCGFGHVLSSILIGLIGISVGLAIAKVEGLEGIRGDFAAWLLFAFGLAYMVWGIRRGLRRKVHSHAHTHDDGIIHSHNHTHESDHSHIHDRKKTTIWWLFIIFVLGPCEPLIPTFMYPAAKSNFLGVLLVTVAFTVATVGTMAVIVTLGYYGLKNVRFTFVERYAHALGGAVIALSAAAILFLGL
jgi:sulfite exporter TauE/SafE